MSTQRLRVRISPPSFYLIKIKYKVVWVFTSFKSKEFSLETVWWKIIKSYSGTSTKNLNFQVKYFLNMIFVFFMIITIENGDLHFWLLSERNIRFWKMFDVQGHEPFVSYQALERLHRFIFAMAITHISYSCLTMLLAIVKVKHFFFVFHL